MTTDFYIQVILLICILIACGLAMWVCRILRMENYFSKKELHAFLGFNLMYLLGTACILIYFSFKT